MGSIDSRKGRETVAQAMHASSASSEVTSVRMKRALPPDGRFRPDALPGGKALVTWHVGPYDNLHATWKALRDTMEAEGYEGRGAPWEEYVSDCSSVPPEEVRTRIVWPIS